MRTYISILYGKNLRNRNVSYRILQNWASELNKERKIFFKYMRKD